MRLPLGVDYSKFDKLEVQLVGAHHFMDPQSMLKQLNLAIKPSVCPSETSIQLLAILHPISRPRPVSQPKADDGNYDKEAAYKALEFEAAKELAQAEQAKSEADEARSKGDLNAASACEEREAHLRAEVEKKLSRLSGRQVDGVVKEVENVIMKEDKEEVIDVVTPGAERAPPATFEEAFDMVSEAILGEADAELKPHLEVGLKRMKDTPPIKSISAVLGREVGLDEVTNVFNEMMILHCRAPKYYSVHPSCLCKVREMLFMPSETTMKLYPRIMRGAANATASNSEQPAEVLINSLF